VVQVVVDTLAHRVSLLVAVVLVVIKQTL